jgi:hypothetical protein
MIVSEGDDRALYDLVQERNLFRQYDLLANCVEIGLKQGIPPWINIRFGRSTTLPLRTYLSSVVDSERSPFTSVITSRRISRMCQN